MTQESVHCLFSEAWKSLTDKVKEARSNAQLRELSFEGKLHFDGTKINVFLIIFRNDS